MFVMPNRTDAQIGLLNTEGRLSLRELDISFPQFLVSPVLDVAAQDVGAFTERGPIVPLRTCAPLKLKGASKNSRKIQKSAEKR